MTKAHKSKKEDESEKEYYSKKEGKRLKWSRTLVISILFGVLGVDRFMMGDIGLGILKLISLGGLGIWWLVDVILIATKYKFNGIIWEE